MFFVLSRPRSEWTIEYMNCNVGTSDVWFQSSIKIPQPEAEGEEGDGATLAGTDSSSSTGHSLYTISIFSFLVDLPEDRFDSIQIQ